MVREREKNHTINIYASNKYLSGSGDIHMKSFFHIDWDNQFISQQRSPDSKIFKEAVAGQVSLVNLHGLGIT